MPIIREPKVLLMDEPLSNLDAKLRTQMRVELANIHKSLGNTIIYVTHDQTEAMTLGDRIVVMNQGVVQQADTPQNLYDYPVNRFVAGFIGSPSMNFIKGLVMEKAGIPTFCTENDGDIPIPDFLWKILKRQGYIGRNIEFGIRPEPFSGKTCTGRYQRRMENGSHSHSQRTSGRRSNSSFQPQRSGLLRKGFRRQSDR